MRQSRADQSSVAALATSAAPATRNQVRRCRLPDIGRWGLKIGPREEHFIPLMPKGGPFAMADQDKIIAIGSTKARAATGCRIGAFPPDPDIRPAVQPWSPALPPQNSLCLLKRLEQVVHADSTCLWSNGSTQR